MPVYKKPSVDDILRKYGAKIESQIQTSNVNGGDYSREYSQFKSELAPDLTRYERWCQSLGNVIKLKTSEKDEGEVNKSLKIAHLDVQPSQALTLAVMAFVVVFFIGMLASIAIAIIKGSGDADIIKGIANNFPILFFFLMLVLSLFLLDRKSVV